MPLKLRLFRVGAWFLAIFLFFIKRRRVMVHATESTSWNCGITNVIMCSTTYKIRVETPYRRAQSLETCIVPVGPNNVYLEAQAIELAERTIRGEGLPPTSVFVTISKLASMEGKQTSFATVVKGY